MTLDEAIKGEENIADACKSQANMCDLDDPYARNVAYENGKCAEMHKQIAEWLKELKRLKEKEPCEDAVSRKTAKENAWKLCLETSYDNEKVVEMLDDLPTVRPTHRKGKWITKYHGFPPEPTTVCSECGFDRDFNIRSRGFSKIKYCSGCGRRII